MSRKKKKMDVNLFPSGSVEDITELQDTSSMSYSPGQNRKKKGPKRSSMIINADPYKLPVVSETRSSSAYFSDTRMSFKEDQSSNVKNVAMDRLEGGGWSSQGSLFGSLEF